jgi:hypothetical protein
MPFAWTAISLRDILKEIEQETNLSSHANTLPANSELINSSNKASSLGNDEHFLFEVKKKVFFFVKNEKMLDQVVFVMLMKVFDVLVMKV